jgi:hypothetical protein
VYRAFLNIEITDNEAWNAYFADAAMGKMPLYPSTTKLITNNYPPVSFYIVGLAGRLTGDPVLAGRLLSLISVIAIATAIALSVRRLGGTQAAAVINLSKGRRIAELGLSRESTKRPAFAYLRISSEIIMLS